MEQPAINQRLKFLAGKLAESIRAFGLAIGDNSSNTHKYIQGSTRPSPEYLEKVLLRFRNINADWLLTGEGEAFLPDSNQVQESGGAYQRNFNNSIVANSIAGGATQNRGMGTMKDKDILIEQLRSQLADKERTIQLLMNQLSKP